MWWAGGKDRWGTRVPVVNNVLPDVPTIDESRAARLGGRTPLRPDRPAQTGHRPPQCRVTEGGDRSDGAVYLTPDFYGPFDADLLFVEIRGIIAGVHHFLFKLLLLLVRQLRMTC